MRDPDRIPEIIQTLQKAWERNPRYQALEDSIMIPYLQVFIVSIFVSFLLGLLFGLWLTRKFKRRALSKEEARKEAAKTRPPEKVVDKKEPKKDRWTVGKTVDNVNGIFRKKKR